MCKEQGNNIYAQKKMTDTPIHTVSQTQDVRKTMQVQEQQQTDQKKKLLDYYTLPVEEESRALEQELRSGPPSHIKKLSERIQWKNKMRNQIEEARMKEAEHHAVQRVFMNISGSLVNDMENRLDGLQREYTVDKMSASFAACMDQCRAFQMERLVMHEKVDDKMKTLGSLLTQLQVVRPQNFTPEDAQKMVEQYQSLNLAEQATAAKYLDHAASDAKACHIILTHCVAAALCNMVNNRELGTVDESQFAVLCGMTSASAVAVGTMCRHQDFKQRRAFRVDEAKRIEKETETREENIAYIKKGINAKGEIPEKWDMAEYAGLMEQILGDKLATMSLNDTANAVQQMRQKVEANLPALRLMIAKRDDLTFGMPSLKEKLLKSAVRAMGDTLLKEDISAQTERLSGFIVGASGGIADAVAHLRKRADHVSKTEGLSKLVHSFSSAKLAEIIDQDEDEAAFEARVQTLSLQAVENLRTAERLIHAKVSPMNRQRVLSSLIAMNGETLLNGAHAVVALTTEHYLKYLNQYAPAAARKESIIRQVMKDTGLPAGLEGAVGARLSRHTYHTMEEMRDAVRDIPATAVRNRTDFEEAVKTLKLSGSQWALLRQWQEENLDIAGQADFQSMLKGKLAEPEFAASEGGITAEEYEKLHEAEKLEQSMTQSERYQLMLKGDALCRCSDAFVGAETLVLNALGELLKEKAFDLPGLEHVHGLQDMGAMPYTAFQSMTRGMRLRLTDCAQHWDQVKVITGANQILQKDLMKEILSGKVTANVLLQRAKEENEKRNLQDKADRMRFKAMLGGTADAPEKLKYRYLDANISTAVFSKDARVVRRMERLRHAERVWMDLRERGTEGEASLLFRKGEKELSDREKIAKLKTLISMNGEIPKLLDGCIKEMQLIGMESILLGSGQAAQVFTSQEVEEYNKKIDQITEWYIPRLASLEEKISQYKIAEKEHETNEELRKRLENEHDMRTFRGRMVKIAAMLEPAGGGTPTEEEKARNLRKCGVASWQDALDMFEDILKQGPEQLAEEKKDLAAVAEKQRQMENRILKRGEEKYRPILDHILADPECWQNAMLGDAESCEKYLDMLEERISAPMDELNSMERFFAEQILMMRNRDILGKTGNIVLAASEGTFAEQIMKGMKYTKGQWKMLFRYCCDELSAHKVGNASMDTRYQEILKKDQQIAPYLVEILGYHVDGMEALTNDTKLKSVLDETRENVLTNLNILETFLKTEPLTEGEKVGLRDHTRRWVVYAQDTEFEKALPKLLKQYREANAKDQQDVQRAKVFFAEKAVAMHDIADKQQKGRDAEKADRETLDSLRKQRYTIGSPLFEALGGTQAPTVEQIQSARVTLQERYEGKDLPQPVLDCLLERCLSGKKMPKTEVLEPDVKWLTETYQTILTTVFDGKVQLKGDLAQELLMSQYMKYVKGGQPQPPGAEDLKESLRDLTARYDMLYALDQFKTDDPMLAAQCMDLAECMKAAVHTMGTDEFKGLLQRRLQYLKAANTAAAVFHNALEPYKEKMPEGVRLRTYIGLQEYFREELLQGSMDMEQLRKKAEVLLSNENHRFYLNDPTSLLGQQSFDDLTDEETSLHGVADRKTLETLITGSGSEAVLKAYNGLNVEQRQLFALALENPAFIGNDMLLPGAQLMEGNVTNHAQLRRAHADVAAFTEGSSFAPQVNYARAVHRLSGADGTLDEKAFAGAMAFVRDCTRVRFAAIPVDWERLADAEQTLSVAHSFAGERSTVRNAQIPELVESAEQLKEQLKKEASASGHEPDELKQFLAMDDMQMNLVVLALQNRTMLDQTTIQGLEGFANHELREDFISNCIHDRQSVLKEAVHSDSLTYAMKTLYSCQVRDDVDLRGRMLRKDDFALHALERKTAIDWDLLKNAVQLVNEITRETLRLNNIRKATQLIEVSGNEKAAALYREQKARIEDTENPCTQDEFSAFLEAQAQADDKLSLLAGYRALSDRERGLFIKALGSREILDISKKGIMGNRFGQNERDYADPVGRNALLNEYMENTMGKGGGVELKKDAYSRALASSLSTQVDDTVDFVYQPDMKLEDALTSKSNIFKSPRGTGVDWKLISRALQLVYRASNERLTYLEDRELYVSQGDLSQTGLFTFESAYMRKNIHNAGNRFTRFFGRRVRAKGEAFLKTPSKYMKVPLLNPVDKESDWKDKFADAAGAICDFYQKSYGKDIAKGLTGSAIADAIEEYLEDGSTHIGYVKDAAHIAEDIYDHIQLTRAKSAADAAAEEDAQRTLAAQARQTEEGKQLSQNAIERNKALQEQGKTKAHERKNDDLIQSVMSIAGTVISDVVGDETGMIEKACEEAGELINFIRNAINDRSCIEKYFAHREEAKDLRAKAKMNISKIGDLELIRDARGFENETEMASYVGLNITRSLLFCAGPYNKQKGLRILAIATLTALGKKDAIGLQDSSTANEVYDALMGGAYR